MQIIKKSTLYLGSSIINKIIPFVLLPIITRYLTPQEYGTLSIYMIFITLYSAFIGMALHMNISKNFFTVSKDELSVYIGNIFYILGISFSVYFLLTYLFSLWLDSVFSIPTNWLLLIPCISVMVMINEINTTILRNEQRAYMFGIFEITNSAIKMGFTVLFLVLFSMGWYSQVLGTLIGAMMFFTVSIIYLRKRNYITFEFDRKKISSILYVSVPLIPHILGSIIIAMSDRLFIESMVSIEAVGIYSVGYMFGMVVMLFTDSFIKAWSPWFYKNLSSVTENKKKQIVKYTYFYILAVFILALAISIIGEFILPYFVDEQFYGASKFIPWIALGYAIQGVYKIFFPYLVHMSRTFFLAFSTVFAAVLNLVFNYIFIKQFGTVGAAYATMLAFLVSALLVFFYQKKYYEMPWTLWKKMRIIKNGKQI